MTRYQSDLPGDASAIDHAQYTLKTSATLQHEGLFNQAEKSLSLVLAEYGHVLPTALKLALCQQQALCTYKDDERPPEQRFERALQLLQQADPLKHSNNSETLGLAGAISKRQWQHNGRHDSLERALGFYRRGAELGEATDWYDKKAYCAINLVFLLDNYCAQLKGSDVVEVQLVDSVREQARQWREQITQHSAVLAAEQTGSARWWSQVTVAEALFGLGEFEQARGWLEQARHTGCPSAWQQESLLRQLAQLMAVRWPEDSSQRQQAYQLLSAFMPSEPALASLTEGKLGLALSGGGFRASFYHIGVLARLAELDLLRKVEVISCVSGGSILGAHYYLELQQLLESKPEHKISRTDYIALVHRLERAFLSGVQTNIRSSIFSHPLRLLKMLSPGYSRTHRLAELYEQRLYHRVADNRTQTKRHMDELMVQPHGCDNGFSPAKDNWNRQHKVPMLVLNATTLNTGHSWQFTARWMGEAPWAVDTAVDANTRLNWFYYSEATAPEYKKMRLGHAVAASSGVPGLFKPLAMTDLYQGFTPQLVDGGIYDNQGTAALLDKGCDHILVSDASGQLATNDSSSTREHKVVVRSSEIFQERMRTMQQRGLNSLQRHGLLKSLCHIHLKKDLHGPQLSLGAEPVHDQPSNRPLTEYGIHRDYQHAIAAIRTDLDHFSDNEARALMLSGYRMVERYLPDEMRALGQPCPGCQRWGFTALAKDLGDLATDPALLDELQTAQHRFFRWWKRKVF